MNLPPRRAWSCRRRLRFSQPLQLAAHHSAACTGPPCCLLISEVVLSPQQDESSFPSDSEADNKLLSSWSVRRCGPVGEHGSGKGSLPGQGHHQVKPCLVIQGTWEEQWNPKAFHGNKNQAHIDKFTQACFYTLAALQHNMRLEHYQKSSSISQNKIKTIPYLKARC